MMTARGIFSLFLAVVATSGCDAAHASPIGNAALRTPPHVAQPVPKYASVLIPNVPHVAQKPDFCGEAVTESWVRALGYSITQDQVFELSGMAPERGMGATTRELVVALKRLGFQTGAGFDHIAAASPAQLDAQFATLHADLSVGVPSIVCTHFDDRPPTTEHFRLVLGYDAAVDEVIYHEPALPNAGYQRMSRTRFLSLWPLKYSNSEWTIIAADRDGHIAGLTNWRLAGLQQRIRRGALPPFEALLSTTTKQFYNEDEGGNYAQARYLLYYLQEHGLLARYYQEFKANQPHDATGIETLKRVLVLTDLGDFKRSWERWVLALR